MPCLQSIYAAKTPWADGLWELAGSEAFTDALRHLATHHAPAFSCSNAAPLSFELI